jgi:glutaredoxin
MTGSTRQRLETATNIAILVLAAVMCVILIRDYVAPRIFPPSRGRGPAPAASIPSPIRLAGLDFSRSDRTLLFVISSTCPYCRKSEEFYRSLTGKAREYKNIQFAAALPQPEPEAREYIQQAGLDFRQVVSADLPTIGIAGTPTLVLLDKNGNVLRYWLGVLPPEGQQRVIAAIQTRP